MSICKSLIIDDEGVITLIVRFLQDKTQSKGLNEEQVKEHFNASCFICWTPTILSLNVIGDTIFGRQLGHENGALGKDKDP